jgi:catechol 2,3-dioxygenase-like lactoylglutathione lyase family enzyme
MAKPYSRDMTNLSVFRVIIPAGDLETSVRFYSSLLDQSGMQVSGGRHYFKCGGVVLAVYSPAGDGDTVPPRANFGHVYFSTTDLEACYQRAQAVGGLSRETGDGGLPMGAIAKRPWGERSFYVADPFGNPLCFVDSSTLFTGAPA